MSSSLELKVARLEQLLEETDARAKQDRQSREEADARAKQERQSREEADVRAEQERQRAEQERQRAEQERRSRDEAEQLTRKTTLIEYLDLCHKHLFQSISVQTNKSLSTQGDTTNPNNKLRPDWLRPWNEFLTTQQDTQGRLQAAYTEYDTRRVFESPAFIEGLGIRVAARKVASEGDLANLQRETVETPVASIITYLQSLPTVRDEFTLGNGIFFDNHPNGLSDAADEVSQHLEALQPFTPVHARPSFSGLRADQICVYTSSEDAAQRKLAFVVEYKPPHKLTLASLRLGLRDMDIKSVIDRGLVPSAESPEHIQYHADRLVASVITQTFSYMIQGGTQYGYITTGEAFVFLHIELNDPKTIYYHLVEPDLDVVAQQDANEDFVHRTAISQVLAFSLLALESASGNQRWRQDAVDSLETWTVDYEAILRSIPDSVRTNSTWTSLLDSTYHPETYTPSPHSRSACRPASAQTFKDRQGSPDTSDQEPPSESPSRRVTRAQTKSRAAQSPPLPQTTQRGRQRRSFCTQLCLKGLVEQGYLDTSCPNVSDHRGKENGCDRHGISRQRFLTLLYKQLEKNRDDDCYPLGKQGARGALFKVTLTSHGYTVAAKGTVKAFVKELQHEHQVYQHLMALQGICVPVCLGSLDLTHPYYYDIGVLIVHMMILSWAGDNIEESQVSERIDQRTLPTMVMQSITDVHYAGVLHADLRTANMLWSQETGRIMLIDFERSKLIGIRQALMESSPNQKRKWCFPGEQAVGKAETINLTGIKSRYLHELISAQKEVVRTFGL